MQRYYILLTLISLIGTATYGQENKSAPPESLARFTETQRELLADADSILSILMKEALQHKGTPIFSQEVERVHAMKDSLYRRALGDSYQHYLSTRFYASPERRMALEKQVQAVKDSLLLNTTEDEK